MRHNTTVQVEGPKHQHQHLASTSQGTFSTHLVSQRLRHKPPAAVANHHIVTLERAQRPQMQPQRRFRALACSPAPATAGAGGCRPTRGAAMQPPA